MTPVQRLKAGETLLTAWSSIPDPIVVDTIAQTSVETVTLDMQHGGHSESSVLNCIQPLLHRGKGAIVRVPVGRFDMASRALDMGADAVIAPMINTIEDARLFANAMKFPPMGERSWGPTRTFGLRGITDANAYLKSANSDTLAIAMVETRAALAILDDILALEGIDGIFVGPSDFSIAWSHGKSYNPADPDMMEAIADIAKRTRAAGKIPAAFAITVPAAHAFRKMGMGLIAANHDVGHIKDGAEAFYASARA